MRGAIFKKPDKFTRRSVRSIRQPEPDGRGLNVISLRQRWNCDRSNTTFFLAINELPKVGAIDLSGPFCCFSCPQSGHASSESIERTNERASEKRKAFWIEDIVGFPQQQPTLLRLLLQLRRQL